MSACVWRVPSLEKPTLRYSNTVTKGTRSSRPDVSSLSRRAVLSCLLELPEAVTDTPKL